MEASLLTPDDSSSLPSHLLQRGATQAEDQVLFVVHFHPPRSEFQHLDALVRDGGVLA